MQFLDQIDAEPGCGVFLHEIHPAARYALEDFQEPGVRGGTSSMGLCVLLLLFGIHLRRLGLGWGWLFVFFAHRLLYFVHLLLNAPVDLESLLERVRKVVHG